MIIITPDLPGKIRFETQVWGCTPTIRDSDHWDFIQGVPALFPAVHRHCTCGFKTDKPYCIVSEVGGFFKCKYRRGANPYD